VTDRRRAPRSQAASSAIMDFAAVEWPETFSRTDNNDLRQVLEAASPLEIISRVRLSSSPLLLPLRRPSLAPGTGKRRRRYLRNVSLSWSVPLFRGRARNTGLSTLGTTLAGHVREERTQREPGVREAPIRTARFRPRRGTSCFRSFFPQRIFISQLGNPCLNQHLTYEKGRLRRHSISPCASLLSAPSARHHRS